MVAIIVCVVLKLISPTSDTDMVARDGQHIIILVTIVLTDKLMSQVQQDYGNSVQQQETKGASDMSEHHYQSNTRLEHEGSTNENKETSPREVTQNSTANKSDPREQNMENDNKGEVTSEASTTDETSHNNTTDNREVDQKVVDSQRRRQEKSTNNGVELTLSQQAHLLNDSPSNDNNTGKTTQEAIEESKVSSDSKDWPPKQYTGKSQPIQAQSEEGKSEQGRSEEGNTEQGQLQGQPELENSEQRQPQRSQELSEQSNSRYDQKEQDKIDTKHTEYSEPHTKQEPGDPSVEHTSQRSNGHSGSDASSPQRRKTKFSLDSPDKQIQSGKLTDARVTSEEEGGSNNEEQHTEEFPKEDSVPHKDFDFRKKDPRRSRTQSFQLVLLTASLKLLKHSVGQQMSESTSNSEAGKNFQSFIQAPVLLSISNLKGDNIAIGQQLPFSHKSGLPKSDEEEPTSEGYDYDEDTMLQQQRLTLNALKKLSLLPMIMNDDELKPARKPLTSKLPKEKEPYHPAQVDLLSFASLTRQSKHLEDAPQASQPKNPTPSVEAQGQVPSSQLTTPQRLPSVGAASATTPAPARNNGIPPSYLNLNEQKTRRTPAAPNSAVVPPSSMLNRRLSGAIHVHQPQPQQGFPLPHQQPQQQQMEQPQQQPSLPHTTAQRPGKQLQQIKGLRSPMYVPAVLRKTVNGALPVHSDSISPSETPQIVNNLHLLTHGNEMTPSSSRALINSFESTDLVVNSVPFSKYEDQVRASKTPVRPTRRHWLKDENVFKCGIPTCPRVFNFFERRHHCRKCGGIYCKEHTSHYLYINHLAQFTTGGRGTLSKVCDSCIADYNKFINEEFGTNNKKVETTQPAPARVVHRNVESEPVAGSVLANWSWSSF